jgi:hypothetical protein
MTKQEHDNRWYLEERARRERAAVLDAFVQPLRTLDVDAIVARCNAKRARGTVVVIESSRFRREYTADSAGRAMMENIEPQTKGEVKDGE